ncbi:hypothetical protein BCEP4_760013 [Burkholderia cepacia]|nr:hypothetical protein BCEP4_760013 [Burkholderia cepacia]
MSSNLPHQIMILICHPIIFHSVINLPRGHCGSIKYNSDKHTPSQKDSHDLLHDVFTYIT